MLKLARGESSYAEVNRRKSLKDVWPVSKRHWKGKGSAECLALVANPSGAALDAVSGIQISDGGAEDPASKAFP